jgi:hypothetical protein
LITALSPTLLAGLFLLVLAVIIGPPSPARTPQANSAAVDDPFEKRKSQVWDIYGEYAVRGFKVHRASLQAMVNSGLKKVTGREDPNQAWHSLLDENDVIALKFTRIGSRTLGTNTCLAGALLNSLYRAGFKPENIMLVDLDVLPREAQGTRPCSYGWQQEQVDFYSDRDYLPRWLEEVTAIINIPSVMDDNIVGLRCSLANLTLPMLKQPARLYMNRGDPFIADIYSLPEIRAKVRLHIANGLRMLYYGGPEVNQRYIYEHGSLLFSTDPVALDQVVLQLLRRARRTMPLPEGVTTNLSAGYLDTAYAFGLGYNDLNFIDYHFVKHGPIELFTQR